jgi:uncharacterized protein YegL
MDLDYDELEIWTTPKSKLNVAKATISKLHIRSDIRFRYAKTVVQSYVKNPSTTDAQEVEFELVLPEKSFISNFTIETGGKTYVSRVEEKEEAKQIYDQAVSSGQSAGLVDAREGNIFAVQANVGASEKLLFTLTYEQLLVRRLSKYEHVINLNPKQIVNDLKIDVYINESLPVIHLNVPELKQSSNDVTSDLEANEVAIITEGENSNQVHVQYAPTPDFQKELNDDGVSGQFIVQYDVDRKNQSSDVQVFDGYMVHFFAPENLKVLPKHVVFVLDTSGSMSGEKMVQLKDAMVTILSDLKDQDHFSILTFNYGVSHWKSLEEKESEKPHKPIYKATEYLVEEAIDFVVELAADGGTNINDALVEAVEVVHDGQQLLTNQVTPSVIFLTDGQPTSGVSNPTEIRNNLKAKNSDVHVPVYGLAFGSGADYNLLKDISSDNRAFARKIFAESDATIQLEDFYMEISSPLLNNVAFQYVGDVVVEPTENILPSSCFHSGSEIVTVAKLKEVNENTTESMKSLELVIRGESVDGDYEKKILPCTILPYPKDDDGFHDGGPRFPCIPFPYPPLPLPPVIEVRREPVNFVERLWAFLTIEKLLDDKADNGNITKDEREEKATKLALEYNFVSDVTSLVVVKPNVTSSNSSESNVTDSNSSESLLNLKPVGQRDLGASQISSYPQYAFNAFSFGSAGPPLKSPPRGHGGMSMILKSSMSGALPFSNRKSRPRPAPKVRITGGVNPSTPFYGAKNTVTTRSWATSTTPQHTTTYDSADYDSDYSDEEEAADIDGTTATTTTKQCNLDQCKITLFSKTLLRGESIELTGDVADLSVKGFAFDNKVTSLEVSGPCTWALFKDANFTGTIKTFSAGPYRNAVSIGKLLRKASSVRNEGC